MNNKLKEYIQLFLNDLAYMMVIVILFALPWDFYTKKPALLADAQLQGASLYTLHKKNQLEDRDKFKKIIFDKETWYCKSDWRPNSSFDIFVTDSG